MTNRGPQCLLLASVSLQVVPVRFGEPEQHPGRRLRPELGELLILGYFLGSRAVERPVDAATIPSEGAGLRPRADDFLDLDAHLPVIERFPDLVTTVSRVCSIDSAALGGQFAHRTE